MVSRTEYSEERNRLDRLFDKTIDLATELEHESLAKQLAATKERFSDDQLRLVVCGEFKQGKSSLINALLNQPNLLPVDVDITTSVVTTVAYAEQERVELIRTDARGESTTTAISRAEIPDYVTENGNPRNRHQALLVSINAPIEPLSAGLMVVDTPGVGGVNLEHSAITYSYLANADIVLFVCDANSPMTVPELQFAERIHEHCERIVFVMTKIDQVDDYESIIQSNKEKLSKRLSFLPMEIEIIPVSSSLKFAWLERDDPIDLEESNFPKFEERLWNILREERGKIIIERSAMRIRTALEELRAPVQLALTVYDEHTQQELDQIEQQLNATMAALQEVKLNANRWKRELNSEIGELRNEVGSSMLMRQRLRVKHNFQKYLNSDELVAKPEQIGSQVIGDLTLSAETINQAIAKRSATIRGRIIDQLDAQLDNALGPSISIDASSPDLSHVSEIKRSEGVRRSIDYGRHLSISGIGGAGLGGLAVGVAGAIVGTFLAPGVGTVGGFVYGMQAGGGLGMAAGALLGVRSGFEELDTADFQLRRQEIRNLLEPLIEDTFVDIQSQLAMTLSRISDQIEDDLQTAIHDKINALNDQIEAFRGARKHTREEAQVHAASIRKTVARLDEVHHELDRVQTTAPALKSTQEIPAKAQTHPRPATFSSDSDEELDFGDWADEDGS